jgi:hypothetical protein
MKGCCPPLRTQSLNSKSRKVSYLLKHMHTHTRLQRNMIEMSLYDTAITKSRTESKIPKRKKM